MTNEQLQLFDEILSKSEELYQIVKKIEDDNFAILGIGIGRSERNEIHILRAFWKWLKIENYVDDNIFERINLKHFKARGKRQALTFDEIEKLRKENKFLKEQLNKE